MILIGLADLHGDASRASRMQKELEGADVVLVAGDITNFGNAAMAERVLEPLRSRAKRVLAVAGNCDYPEVDLFLEREGLSLHGRGLVVDGVGFAGAGASLPCPGRTPNEVPEGTLMDVLTRGVADLPPQTPWVLVTHQPAYLTKNDAVGSGVHVGSKELRRFVVEKKPLFHLTGHIHEGVGVDAIQGTKTANPGLFRNGRYVRAVIENGALIEVEIRKAGS